MRQRYLALLSVFASLPAMALTFQTRLENIEWTVAGDQFECRLTQPITDFGAGEFVRRAGEQPTFRLNANGYSAGRAVRPRCLRQPRHGSRVAAISILAL